jgi:flagellar motor switch protein FliN/FliY
MGEEEVQETAAGEGAENAEGEAAGEPLTIGEAGAMDIAIYDITVDVTAVLGTASMRVSQILKLGRGAVVELDRLVGEAVELRAENKLVALGEVVVIDDRLGVALTEIIKGR